MNRSSGGALALMACCLLLIAPAGLRASSAAAEPADQQPIMARLAYALARGNIRERRIVFDREGEVAPGRPEHLAATLIERQDFEGQFPPPGWQVIDRAAQVDRVAPRYLWGPQSCEVESVVGGRAAAWVAAGGNDGRRLPCGTPYPLGARIDTWLTYVLDLRDYPLGFTARMRLYLDQPRNLRGSQTNMQIAVINLETSEGIAYNIYSPQPFTWLPLVLPEGDLADFGGLAEVAFVIAYRDNPAPGGHIGAILDNVVFEGLAVEPTPTISPTATQTPRPTATPTVYRTPTPVRQRAFLPHIAKPLPTPSPTATLTPRAIPSSTPVPQPTPTIKAGERIVCSNVILNGDFERGPNVGWLEITGADEPIIRQDLPVKPFAGLWAAWFGGYNNAEDALITTYTIPCRPADAGRPGDLIGAELRFVWGMTSRDVTSFVTDILGFGLVDEVSNEVEIITAVDNTAPRNAWRERRVVVSPLLVRRPGWTAARFTIAALTDGSLPTSWFVDNVSLEVCSRAEGVGLHRAVPDARRAGDPVSPNPALRAALFRALRERLADASSSELELADVPATRSHARVAPGWP